MTQHEEGNHNRRESLEKTIAKILHRYCNFGWANYYIPGEKFPSLIEELTHLTQEWQRRHASNDKPFLVYSKSFNFVTIYDGREENRPVKERYDWPHAFLIEACNEAPKYIDQIKEGLHGRAEGAAFDELAIQKAIDDLMAKRILYEENGRYLTLALPVNTSL